MDVFSPKLTWQKDGCGHLWTTTVMYSQMRGMSTFPLAQGKLCMRCFCGEGTLHVLYLPHCVHQCASMNCRDWNEGKVLFNTDGPGAVMDGTTRRKGLSRSRFYIMWNERLPHVKVGWYQQELCNQHGIGFDM